MRRVATAALVLAIVAGAAWAWLGRAAGGGQGLDIERIGVYGRVPDFALIERSGREVRLADFRDTIWLADFIYTECQETCPTQSQQMASLQREFAAEPDLRLVSITVDPVHDTPQVLSSYAGRYGADPERWLFLTGPKATIYALARDGFKLGVVDPTDQQASGGMRPSLGPRPAFATHGSGGLVMHSPRFVLVDRQARIRAYHEPNDPESLTQLRESLRALLAQR